MDADSRGMRLFSLVAIVWTYGLYRRIKEGCIRLPFRNVSRDKSPWEFWTLVVVAVLLDFLFIGLVILSWAAKQHG
jgi:hypothetical protein